MKRLVLTLGLGLLVGCGPYIDEVNEQHRQKVDAKLTEIRAVGQKLATAPPLDADKAPPGELVLVLGAVPSASGNTALLYAEDFGNFDELGLVYARLRDADLVQSCSAALHTEHAPWSANDPELTPAGATGFRASRTYAVLEGLEYVAVLRTKAFARPHSGPDQSTPPSPVAATADAGSPPAGADAGSADAGAAVEAGVAADSGLTVVLDAGAPAARQDDSGYVYSGGYLAAELLFFRIRGAELVGGVRFEAESSEAMTGSPTEFSLEYDLREKVRAALEGALAAHAPNVKLSK